MEEPQFKEFGSLKGTLYSFPEVGDVLPMHNHSENTVHVTFVLDGRFKVSGSNREFEVKAGNFIDWQPWQEHEFIALEPNSRILNIRKNVKIID